MSTEIYESRIGRFTISRDIIRQEPWFIFERLKFIPVRAEALYYGDVIEYMGISPMFDQITEGNEAPYYAIMLSRKVDEDGVEVVDFDGVERV